MTLLSRDGPGGELVPFIGPSSLFANERPNQSLNRTRNGMPRLAVISFSAGRVRPLRAG